MSKPLRRRVYLFMTREREGVGQLLIFSHYEPQLWAGVQTPGGTIEAEESVLDAVFREAFEETGLTQFGTPILLAEDDFENPNERLWRFFFHLPVTEATADAWVHRVYGEGVDGGMDFHLRWVDLPGAGDLDPHFRSYLDLVRFP